MFKSICDCIENFFICIKYPFLKSRNVWTGKFMGYDFTWYDNIPKGWQKAFGEQLCKDLKKALKKDKCLWKFRFDDIKEKYGGLRLYAHNYGDEAQKVLNHYEDISTSYCIQCGRPAEYQTSGWIEFYCKDCIENISRQRYQDPKKQSQFIANCKINKQR